jgi:hypothetical protein
MSKLLEDLKALFIIVLLLVACFFAGQIFGSCKTEKEMGAALNTAAENYNASIAQADIKRLKIEQELWAEQEESRGLRALIAALEARPAEVKYITRTETVLVGKTEYVDNCPRDYLFMLDCGLPVAAIDSSSDGVALTSASIIFESVTLITETDAATKLTATSSLDPTTVYEIPVIDFTIKERPSHKTFGAQVGLFGMLSAPSLEVSVGVAVPWFHPLPELDVASPRVSFNQASGFIGMDAASYNIGKPLPLVDDIWLGVGGSYSTSLQGSIDLTLGSKF